MNVFPTKELKFKLYDSKGETLVRLDRRTEKSSSLVSKRTDKSFIGSVGGNKFKLISSALGMGAFCVLSGSIEADGGKLKVEINKVFRILLSVILLLPIVGIPMAILSGSELANPVFILVLIGQLLMIRYVFIALAFKFLAKESIRRFQNVLDVEWINH